MGTRSFMMLFLSVFNASIILTQICINYGEPGFVKEARGEDPAEKARRLSYEVGRLQKEGRIDEAIITAKEALRLSQQIHGPSHQNVAADLVNLGSLYAAKHDLFNAVAMTKKAADIDIKAYGPDHPEVARDLGNLATLYKKSGQYSDAEKNFQEAERILETWVDTRRNEMTRDEVVALGHIYANHAALYEKLGDHQSASDKLIQAFGILWQMDRSSAANVATRLAAEYEALGQPLDAKTFYEAAADLRK